MNVSLRAAKPADPSMLVNVPKLVTAYYTEVPDPSVPEQRVALRHLRPSWFRIRHTFNEWHILAISHAMQGVW